MSAGTPAASSQAPAAAVASRESASGGLVRVYVWELPVRVTHWLIALSIFVLAFTGFYVGNPFVVAPGEATERFVMGTFKVVHYYAAIVFTLAVLSRIVWMFVGNRHASWQEIVPIDRERRVKAWQVFLFYIFVRRSPPEMVGHNPLAGIAYCIVYLLALVMIATGLAMYSTSASIGSPLRVFDFLVPLFGGLQSARWIHHVGMWLLLGFFVHHIASGLLTSITERNGTMESIFSGFKFLPRESVPVDEDRPDGSK